MPNRPLSVSIIAWFLLVTSGFGLISTFLAINNPMVAEIMAQSPIPIPLQWVISFVGLAITITCGAMMLKGQKWARTLYVGWSAFGFLIGLATSPTKLMLVPGLLFFLIVVFFLFRPLANEYFAGNEVATDEEPV